MLLLAGMAKRASSQRWPPRAEVTINHRIKSISFSWWVWLESSRSRCIGPRFQFLQSRHRSYHNLYRLTTYIPKMNGIWTLMRITEVQMKKCSDFIHIERCGTNSANVASICLVLVWQLLSLYWVFQSDLWFSQHCHLLAFCFPFT